MTDMGEVMQAQAMRESQRRAQPQESERAAYTTELMKQIKPRIAEIRAEMDMARPGEHYGYEQNHGFCRAVWPNDTWNLHRLDLHLRRLFFFNWGLGHDQVAAMDSETTARHLRVLLTQAERDL